MNEVFFVRSIKYDCPILFALVFWVKIIANFRYHFDIKRKKSGNFRHFGPTSKIRLSLKSLWNFWSNEPIKIREGDGRPHTGVLDFCVKGQLISEWNFSASNFQKEFLPKNLNSGQIKQIKTLFVLCMSNSPYIYSYC